MKWAAALSLVLGLSLAASPAHADGAKIVLLAGRASHGAGDHEFHAGLKLLNECLKSVPGVEPIYVEKTAPGEGWPADETVFDGAKAIVFFMDGGGGHPMIQANRLETMQKLMDKGIGVVCMHYAVEVPKGKAGAKFLEWMGGYYESGFSTNPHWVADVTKLPDHPITRGVKPFAIRDEWYFNIRFRPDMKGITPIIVARPDDETRKGVSSSPRGPYQHIVDAKGREEVLAWTVERPDGGRGFGFTGGHAHKNWGDSNFRKLVLNAILWSAKVDVPSSGVDCEVSKESLSKNLDKKR
jgi:type 1 glutamine amidotransferase